MKKNDYYVVWSDDEPHSTFFLAEDKLEAIDLFNNMGKAFNEKYEKKVPTFLEIVNNLPDSEKCKTLSELFDELLISNNTYSISVCHLEAFVEKYNEELYLNDPFYAFAHSVYVQYLYKEAIKS